MTTRPTDLSELTLLGTSSEVFQIGIEYYLSARTAWDRVHYRIVGNLFHHGVEMMLKAILVRAGVTAQQIKGWSHSLPTLWDETKQRVTDDWSRFDQPIAELHRWESIRFGQFPEGKHKSLRIDSHRVAGAIPGKPGHDEYRVCLEDMDELFGVLCREIGFPPQAVRPIIGASQEDYERDNRYAIKWPGPPDS